MDNILTFYLFCETSGNREYFRQIKYDYYPHIPLDFKLFAKKSFKLSISELNQTTAEPHFLS